MRWRAFCEELVDALNVLDVRTVVTLGALLSDSPHTRPTPVSGTAYDPATAAQFGLDRSRYEGPTGIVGIFQDACGSAGIPAVSFWAAIAHYVAQPPNPKATIALLHRVEEILDIAVPLADLPQDAEDWQKLVDEMAAEDDEVTEYIRNLEERDEDGELREASGDAIASEVEKYLRRRDHGGPGLRRRAPARLARLSEVRVHPVLGSGHGHRPPPGAKRGQLSGRGPGVRGRRRYGRARRR